MQHNYCALFVALFVSLSVCTFCLKFYFISSCSFVSKYITRALHINIHHFYVKKKLQSLSRVYRKSASSAQTDGRIATEGPSYTGQTQGSECFKFTQYYWKGPALTKEGVLFSIISPWLCVCGMWNQYFCFCIYFINHKHLDPLAAVSAVCKITKVKAYRWKISNECFLVQNHIWLWSFEEQFTLKYFVKF